MDEENRREQKKNKENRSEQNSDEPTSDNIRHIGHMLTLTPIILRPTPFLLTPHLLLPAPPCLFLFIPFFLSSSRAGKPTDPRREQKAGGGRRGVGGGTSSQGPGPVKDHTVVVEAVCRGCLIGARELSVLCVGISNRQV